MSEFPEASKQSDWILPPNVDLSGNPNAAALAVTTTAATADLASLPLPYDVYDTQESTKKPNPLGRYVNFQAQGGDVFFLFGPSMGSLTTGLVSGVTITNAGTGFTTAPTIGFTGGGGSGAAATATIDTSAGIVTSITVTNPGTGYTSAPTVTFTGGGGSAAAATALLGSPPVAATTNTVSASTGVVTMAKGVAAWIPQGQTLSVKLPSGSPLEPWGKSSAFRFIGYITSTGTATLRVWQSSP
jgi:hypothetical protein